MIRDGDRLSLPPGVTLSPGGLEDAVRGAVFPLNESARFVLARLDGRTFGELVHAFARRFGLRGDLALYDLRLFCADLNAKLLLNVSPTGGAVAVALRWLALCVRTLPLGFLPGMPARRRPIRSESAVRAAASVARGLAAVTVGVGVLTAAVTAVSLGVLGPLQLGEPLGLGACVAAGLIVHEAAHAALLRRIPCCLANTGLRAFVLHPPLAPRRQALVAAAGPGAGLVAGVLVAVLALLLEAEALALGTPTLAAHGLGLTVAGRDGRLACGLS